MITVTSRVVSITEVELRTDLLGTAVSFVQLVSDLVARSIEEFIWADIEAQLQADQRDEALRRAAGPAYTAITGDIIARLERIKERRPLTQGDVDGALAEHVRRCAEVPNPPRRGWL